MAAMVALAETTVQAEVAEEEVQWEVQLGMELKASLSLTILILCPPYRLRFT